MVKFDEIYNTIKQRILSGYYLANSKISEIGLSKEFKCSRTPIREVLQKLENEFLVNIVPKTGSFICDYSKKDLVDFIHVRTYIEALAFNICIHLPHSITPLVKKLEEKYKEMHEALATLTEEGMQAFVQIHYSFHESIVLFTNNKLLIKFFRELNLMKRTSFIKKMTMEDLIRTEEEHLKIIDYLNRKDSAGEHFIIQHLMNKIKDINITSGEENV